ncbi:hypothetical protein FXF53_04130 [Micromonospora sp. WP24]|uniref:hypothetical protein n=1 Tax=Micromonospora sp. WP24 TaxID=2604469 RepID=UPI0011D6AE89|nr:hypothetical protein [Micromonospora sp. WP24]TYC05612.1 hypothetical protein FXF53_04130 [Micromonospora sp. WP24]
MGSGREALTGGLHHVEVWVPDLAAAEHASGWLLGELGWEIFQKWPAGRSWRLGPTYLVLEESPAMSGRRHDRRGPQTYAGYLSDNQGYEVELVATR